MVLLRTRIATSKVHSLPLFVAQRFPHQCRRHCLFECASARGKHRNYRKGLQACANLSSRRKLLLSSAVFVRALALWATPVSDLSADNRAVVGSPVTTEVDIELVEGLAREVQGVEQESSRSFHTGGAKPYFKDIFEGTSSAVMNASHADLINSLRRTERLTDKTADAMLQVDRKWFLDPDNHEALHLAYQDHPVPIGYGETISAPHMHAEALRLLEGHCQHGASVLDVGSGSGYLTGCFGIMVGQSGQVLGVEKHKELAERSMTSLSQAVPELVKSGTVKIMPGNVLGRVLQEYGPFDAIHVGAAAATMPQNLIQKLKPGGRMVIPVGAQNSFQVLKLVDKDEHGAAHVKDLMSVAYVPLTEPGTDPFVGKDEE